MRAALALVLVVAGIRMWIAAWNIPIEAGGLLFAPVLLAAGLLCFFLAVAVIVPGLSRHDGPGFWALFSRLLRF